MTTEDLKKEVEKALVITKKDTKGNTLHSIPCFELIKLQNNYALGHPFVFKSEVMDFIERKFNGEITEESIKEYEKIHLGSCAKCGGYMNDHIFTQNVILRITRDVTKEFLHSELKKIKPLMDKYRIDGFAFAKSNFKMI